MVKHRVRHLPVTEGHQIVGVISDRDIFATIHQSNLDISQLKVGDIQTKDPYVVSLDEPLYRVLLVMADRHIGSAIVTRGGRLAGMFTVTDACRSFGKFLQTCFPEPENDAAA